MPADERNIAENFVQLYKELIDGQPHLAVHNFRCENSDYSDQLNDSRNAYLAFNGYDIQDCYFTYDSRWDKDCADLSFSNKCELSYECIDCEECYNCNYMQDCERCADCLYCYDCMSCKNCFGCVGLRRAEFHIFNKKYSKMDYEARLAEVIKMPEREIRAEMEKLRLKHPHVAMHQRRSENCFGDYVFDSKNCNYGFKLHNCEDCLYTYNSGKLKDCLDVGMLFKSELLYEVIEATDNYNCNFIYWCANCRNCEYVMYCFDCEDCFGCFNLKRKKYHILNKPYEREEYFTLVAKIKNALREQGKYMNFLPDITHRQISQRAGPMISNSTSDPRP